MNQKFHLKSLGLATAVLCYGFQASALAGGSCFVAARDYTRDYASDYQKLGDRFLSREISSSPNPRQIPDIADIRIDGKSDPDPNRAILPAAFPVYAGRGAVVNRPFPGLEPTTLPTVNQFLDYPGCYVACYSRNQENSIYSVGGGIYVMGQVRVPGSYEGRICLPRDYETADISAEPKFKALCAENLADACSGSSCWAGGDTGGWFGIP